MRVKMILLFAGVNSPREAYGFVKKWNEKSGDVVECGKTPHERLLGTFSMGGANFLTSPNEPEQYLSGALFITTCQESSYVQINAKDSGSLPTFEAFVKWLERERAEVIPVLIEEIPALTEKKSAS